MTLRKVNWMQGDGSAPDYTAEDDRQLIAAVLGGGFLDEAIAPGVGAVGRGHGVLRGFGVTPNGTPNNTVKVATGLAAVRGTQVNDQGPYIVRNDAEVSLGVAAADGSNARRDLVILTVRDDEYPAFTQDDAILDVIEGPADGSLADPTVPEDTLVLARLTVPAGAGGDVISGPDIAPLAPQVRATGGITPVASLAAWPSPQPGDVVYRTDVDRLAVRSSGSVWRHKELDYVARGGPIPVEFTGQVFWDVNVVFPVTFVSAPVVVATINNSVFASVAALSAGPTTTGCTIRVWANPPNAVVGVVGLMWTAIGPVAA